jgi:hypothetical protein
MVKSVGASPAGKKARRRRRDADGDYVDGGRAAAMKRRDVCVCFNKTEGRPLKLSL